jgi:hypothetical protein
MALIQIDFVRNLLFNRADPFPSQGSVMRRKPQTDRTQRSWIDRIFESKGCATDRFDCAGNSWAVVYADLNDSNAGPLLMQARPAPRRDNPRVATGASIGRDLGRSGFGPFRTEAVGRPARQSQTRAGRSPHPFALRFYRAALLTTLGCVGFAMFWWVLHIGSQ